MESSSNPPLVAIAASFPIRNKQNPASAFLREAVLLLARHPKVVHVSDKLYEAYENEVAAGSRFTSNKDGIPHFFLVFRGAKVASYEKSPVWIVYGVKECLLENTSR